MRLRALADDDAQRRHRGSAVAGGGGGDAMSGWDAAACDAIAWLQWRLVGLLRRHDAPQPAGDDRALPPDSAAPWRRLAALTGAAETLLDELMPRIVRQLSFALPRTTRQEPLPAHGRVDWPRTLAANWRRLPDHPPLSVVAHRRGRLFDTPENLLAVTALLELRAALRRELEWLPPDQRHALLRQPLARSAERCDRMLALPPLAGLVPLAERARADDAWLARQLAERDLAGSQRAYGRLVPWRAALARLAAAGAQPPLNASAMHDRELPRVDELFRWWLFYEWIDVALQQGAEHHRGADHHEALLSWPATARRCRLRRSATLDTLWQHAPAVVPDLYLEVQHAADPRAHQVVLVAHWLPPDQSHRGGLAAAKRLLADLLLSDRRHGVIVHALPAGTTDAAYHRIAPAADGLAHHAAPPPLDVWCVPPSSPEHATSRIATILEAAFRRLETEPPACHGIFLDQLSVAERGAAAGLHGEDLVLCPKPHLGPGRLAVVSRSLHCCRDATRCHIAGRPDARPPLRPPRSIHDLQAEVRLLLVDGDLARLDDALVERVSSAVAEVTRSFAAITGVLNDLGRFDARIADLGLDRSLGLLDRTGRESLALAIYIRDQLDDIRALDYSAAIVHVTRVLERELARRIQQLDGWQTAWQRSRFVTLGTLPGVRGRDPAAWPAARATIAARWRGQVDPGDPDYCAGIDTFVDELEVIVRIRNQAAHTTPVGRLAFRDALRRIGGGGGGGALRLGLLNTLLLAWPIRPR